MRRFSVRSEQQALLRTCARNRPACLPWLATLRCTQDTTEATRLEFLPHHFLLGSVGATGVLRYQDTSTGRIVATHRTKQVRCWACKPLLRLSGCR